MRIAVRSKCQRHGIGRFLIAWLRDNYPVHLELDVSTDNERAINFYRRVGLQITRKYQSGDKVEFACFETPPFTEIQNQKNVIEKAEILKDQDQLSDGSTVGSVEEVE